MNGLGRLSQEIGRPWRVLVPPIQHDGFWDDGRAARTKTTHIEQVLGGSRPVVRADEALFHIMHGGYARDPQAIADDAADMFFPWGQCLIEFDVVVAGTRMNFAVAADGLTDPERLLSFDGIEDDPMCKKCKSLEPKQGRCAALTMYMGVGMSGRWYGPIGLGGWIADDDGRLVTDPKAGRRFWFCEGIIDTAKVVERRESELIPEELDHELSVACRIMVSATMQTVQMVNASNIVVEREGLVSDGMSKRERNESRVPGISYSVLKIRKGKQTMRLPSVKGEAADLPLHLVRGHFKRYGEEGRGLFLGKYKKTVWCPTFLRGDPVFGASRHDYEVSKEAASE